MHDVIITGAGPVGLYLASLLEKRLNVLVLDKSRELGKKADSGLYSLNLGDFIPFKKEWIEHQVSGATFHSPREQIEFRKPATAAYVVDREKFQLWLSRQLKSKILLKTFVKEIEINKNVKIKTTQGTFESKMLIGCDGASSFVRKHFGVAPQELVNGIIGITKEKNTNDFVDLYFDTERIKDGFFWKIPRGETTEYGALGKNVNFLDLENFFKIKKYEKRAAFMNVGLFKTYFPRTILVGEAAGQVKPWSFGGIIFGFTCSQIARDVIFEAFRKNDFSEEFLKKYDELWKKKIGKTIRLGLRLREMLKEMDNEKLDRYFRLAKKIPFLNKLDMDFPNVGMFG